MSNLQRAVSHGKVDHQAETSTTPELTSRQRVLRCLWGVIAVAVATLGLLGLVVYIDDERDKLDTANTATAQYINTERAIIEMTNAAYMGTTEARATHFVATERAYHATATAQAARLASPPPADDRP